MAGYFEATGDAGGAAIELDEVEVSILRSLAVQLLELIGPGPAGGEGGEAEGGEAGLADSLDALFAEGPSQPPGDPALARLFPDAYGEPGEPQDEATRRRAAEFRRFTEGDLRSRKRGALLAMVRGLDALSPSGSEPEGAAAVAMLKLGPEEARQWLGALNDLRLTIASRLDIADVNATDDATDELLSLPDTDPNKPMAIAYFWLGGLQESLVAILMP